MWGIKVQEFYPDLNLKDSALFPENVYAIFSGKCLRYFLRSASGVFPAFFRNHSGKKAGADRKIKRKLFPEKERNLRF